VTAISRSNAKKDDATKLGASKYIATGSSVKDGIAGHERSLDLIICTISESRPQHDSNQLDPPELPVAEYLPLLKPTGTLVLVGVVPTPMSVPAFPLITGKSFNPRYLSPPGRCSWRIGAVGIAGSNIGSSQDIKDMFQFAKEHKVEPWINKWDMLDINKAMPAFQRGEAKYRFVLVNKDNGGQL
jgi:alcohol dehydrogenase (NADP+)